MPDYPTTGEQLAAIAVVEKLAVLHRRYLSGGVGSLRAALDELQERITSEAENDVKIGAEFDQLLPCKGSVLPSLAMSHAQLGALIRVALTRTGHIITPPEIAPEIAVAEELTGDA